MELPYGISRRNFLFTAAKTCASAFFLPGALSAAPRVTEKMLRIHNIHTGENFCGIYAIGHTYIPEALKELQFLMRDWRLDLEHGINPGLYDMMHELCQIFDCRKSFDLVCGYRSSETNKSLRAASGGVAKKSLHMAGRAVDISLGGVPLAKLRDAIRSMKAGGVGYYPKSGFVHMDIRDRVVWW